METRPNPYCYHWISQLTPERIRDYRRVNLPTTESQVKKAPGWFGCSRVTFV